MSYIRTALFLGCCLIASQTWASIADFQEHIRKTELEEDQKTYERMQVEEAQHELQNKHEKLPLDKEHTLDKLLHNHPDLTALEGYEDMFRGHDFMPDLDEENFPMEDKILEA